MNNVINNFNLQSKPKTMLFIQIYLLFTIILYFLGPIRWHTKNTFVTFLFVFIYQAALWIGYNTGYKKQLVSTQEFQNIDKKFLNFIKISIIVSIAISILMIIRDAGAVSFSEIINNIRKSLFDPASTYQEYMNSQVENTSYFGGKILSYSVTLAGPFTIAAKVLTVLYYKYLPAKFKVLGICGFVFEVAYKLLTGTNEGIFDILILLCVTLYMKHKMGMNNPNSIIYRHYKKIFVTVALVLIISFLSFFVANIYGRTSGLHRFPTLGINHYDKNTFLLKITPDFLDDTVTYLTIYLSEGYYGLSLATTLDWVPTFGFASSSFVKNNINELLNIDITKYTYQGRAEIYGWKAGRNWHTAYTWFANDISFYGVAVLMFIIGYLFARAYRDAVENKNHFALIIFSLMCIQLLFLPANNKLFAMPETFMAYWVYLFIWWFKKNNRSSNAKEGTI